jgi:hypothetical protein
MEGTKRQFRHPNYYANLVESISGGSYGGTAR